jgi:alpha-glucosidase
VISYEGVKGNENNKWSADINSEHTVTIPFIRMVAGPMDFTPGAVRNAQPANYRISFQRPMALGTRCHQVAMYVVYESPLQMLCDAPSAYYQEKETTAFISRIPTTWDETHVLEAKVADYIVTARRQGDTWYLGAMTDATPRQLTIDFSFLGEGEFTLTLMKDGLNADRYAEDYKMEMQTVRASSKVPVALATSGGWVAIVSPK